MKNSNEWLKSVANNKNSVKMQKKVYHKWLIPEFVIRNVLGAIIVIRDLYIFFTGILSMKYNEQNGILSNAELCALLLLLATLSLSFYVFMCFQTLQENETNPFYVLFTSKSDVLDTFDKRIWKISIILYVLGVGLCIYSKLS